MIDSEGQNKVFVTKDGETEPILSGFRFTHVNPHLNSRLIGHPVEDGTTVFDNKVVDPRRISITGTVFYSDRETFKKIDEMQQSKEFAFYMIESYSDAYYNMALERASIRESAESPFAAEVHLDFLEILKVKAQKGKPRDDADASTKKT